MEPPAGVAAPVSVVIVNYNGAEVLEPCLHSVFAQPYRPIEVILVDNASTDGSVEAAMRLFPSVRFVRNEANRGFAQGNNQGVALATGRYIALLNNDTVVGPRWLPGLVAMLQRPGMGVVTSRVITDGVPQEYYDMNGTINYLGYNIMRYFPDLSRVFFAGGASLMFRREDVALPFLDEYFLYHEDVFLSWRLRLLGYEVAMAQDSVVGHRGSVTTRRQPDRLVTFYQERNRLLNALLMYEDRTLAILLPYFLADALAKLAMSIAGGRKSLAGIVAAYRWVATHREWILRRRRELQAVRKVPDRDILRLMSSRIVDSPAVIARVLNAMSRVYARVTGLLP